MFDPSPSLPATPLSEVLLAQLVAELDNEHIRGICLGGSQARGEATPDSDVDIACFVPDSYRPLLYPTLSEQHRSVIEEVLRRIKQM